MHDIAFCGIVVIHRNTLWENCMITLRQEINNISSSGLGIRIVQCGMLEFRQVDYHLLRPEGTNDYQLLYVAEGAEYFYFNGTAVAAKAGCCVLYAPGQKQEYGCSKQEGALVYYCHFCGNGISHFLRDYPIPTERVFHGGTEFSALFSILLDHCADAGVDSAYILALLNLLQYASQQSHAKAEPKLDPINFVLTDIRENYMLDRSIEEYASLCHFSKYYFLRQFKSKTGTTPIAYRNEYRFSIAERLLCDSNLTVDAVSHAVGFSSSTYFCRLYKKSRGYSPRSSREKGSTHSANANAGKK